MTKFTILGCGSSLGSPWITNNWGKLNKKNIQYEFQEKHNMPEAALPAFGQLGFL